MNKFKRAVALLLCVVMLVATMAIIPISAAEEFTNITSAADFYAISNGGNYRLANDITIESTLPQKSGITFDGNGHSITLKSTMTRGAFEALSSSNLKNVTVKAEGNATLAFTSFTGPGTSPVVGTVTNCTLEDITNEVSFTTTSGVGAWAGGIVGNAKGISSFTHCINKGAITVMYGEYLGGIAGVNFGVVDYVRCENLGALSSTKGSGRNAVGGFIGLMYNESSECSVTLKSCVSSGAITTSGDGSFTGAYIAKRDQGILQSCTSCKNTTGIADFGINDINDFVNIIEISSAEEFAAITDGGYYRLTANITITGALPAKSNINFDGNGYSITLKSTMNRGAFVGLTNSVLKNVTVKAESTNQLFASYTEPGTSPVVGIATDCILENVVNEVSFQTTSGTAAWVGSIAGNAFGTCTFTGCINKGNITAQSGEYIGGIVGVNFGEITYIGCENLGAISGTSKTSTSPCFVGGIVGLMYKRGNEPSVTITACISSGNITSTGSNDLAVGAVVAKKGAGTLISSTCRNTTNVGDFGTDGMTNYPFEDISDAAGLAAMVEGGIYRLAADFKISSTIDAKTGITLDGNGHTITLASGMKSGVFKSLTNSTLKNLTVNAENNALLYFNAGPYDVGAGAVVALIQNTTLENITNNVSYTISSGTSYAGGVVGSVGLHEGADTCYLINCVNTGNITAGGGEYLGGVAGVNFDLAYYTGCKNYGNIHGILGTTDYNNVGGIIGYVFSGESQVYMSKCVNWGKVTGEGDGNIGGLTGSNDSASIIKQADCCYNFANVADFGNNGVTLTNTNVKNISNASDLLSMEKNTVYILKKDFETMGGITLPEGVILNGNGHTITLKNASSGLFASATDAAIIDLNVAGSVTVNENGSGSIGAVIDTATAPIVLKNVTNRAAVTVNGTGYSSIGGVVGALEGNGVSSVITAANNYGAINANAATAASVGGILGAADANVAISNSTNHGSLVGATVGGIIGKASSSASSVSLNSCFNYGSCVSSNLPFIMGICGANELSTGFSTTSTKDLVNTTSAQAYTLKLKDTLSMYFYLSNKAFERAVSYTVKTDKGYKVTPIEGTADLNGIEYKLFEVSGIAPTDFDKEFILSVTIDRGNDIISSSEAYCVKDYCIAQINNASSEPTLKRLCVDLLNYGAEAQSASGYEGTLMNADLTSEQKALGTINTPSFTQESISYTGTENPAFATWSEDVELNPENGLAPTFKFTAPNGVAGMVAHITCAGSGATATVKSFKSIGNDMYSFTLDGLSAADFKDTVTLELRGKGTSVQLNFVLSAYAKEMTEGDANADFASSALKYITSVERMVLDVGAYDITKYAAPVWDGNIVYAESAFIRENSLNDSSVAPITLLYPIDEIISVRSSDTKTLYQEGRDYVVQDGKLIIKTAAQGGTIKILPYYSADPKKEAYTYTGPVIEGTNDTDYPYTRWYMEGDNNTYYYYLDAAYNKDKEGGLMKWNIAVTYKHSGDCNADIEVPDDQSAKFGGLMSKLTSGNEINVVSLGDSITWGASASANHAGYGGIGGTGWGPKQPAYNVMFCDYLEAAYGVKVNFTNYAIGGTTAKQALEETGLYAGKNTFQNIYADDPDIFIIAYGMNDGGETPANEASYIREMVKNVKAQCPDVYVIVVSTCLLGLNYDTSNVNRRYFGDEFEKEFASYDYVVVANVTAVDIALQGYDVTNETNHTGPKKYQDLTGSNSNHPNDFMHRIYLQTIIQSAFGTNKFSG